MEGSARTKRLSCVFRKVSGRCCRLDLMSLKLHELCSVKPTRWSTQRAKAAGSQIPGLPMLARGTTEMVGWQRKSAGWSQHMESSHARFEKALWTRRQSRYSVAMRMGQNYTSHVWWESCPVCGHDPAGWWVLWQNRSTKDWQDSELSPHGDICACQRNDPAHAHCGCNMQVCSTQCTHPDHNVHTKSLGPSTN